MSEETKELIPLETHMYMVSDLAAAAHGDPRFAPTDAVAIRQFEESVKAPGSRYSFHPEDYALVRVGRIDLRTGELLPEPRRFVVSAEDFMAEVER